MMQTPARQLSRRPRNPGSSEPEPCRPCYTTAGDATQAPPFSTVRTAYNAYPPNPTAFNM